MNAAIRLVGHTHGLFLGGRPMLSKKGIVLDLSLDERRVHAKFGRTVSYCVRMHKEQTNKHSSIYIRLKNFRWHFCSLFNKYGM
jgi:hypothetical protein